MKIGLPKLRLSRKLLLITVGITVLLGGSGVTALYLGGTGLMLEGGENAIGGECTDIQTMVLKTPSNRLWLRKFIRMEKASGPDRVRTALRVAGLLAQKNTVDLIHVSVLDSHGPTVRSQMRARAIGAEVLIALKPDNLPDMKSPAMASYYEGPVSDAGRFYGDKVVVDIDEIGAMMTAMRTVEEKPDCVSATPADDKAAKKPDPGKKDKKDTHAATPADSGEQPAEDHGKEPAKDGDDETAHGEQPAKEQSFLDSMLSMVGLGGSDEPTIAAHPPAAVDDSHAVADEPVDDHGDKASDAHVAQPSQDAHSTAEGHDPATEAKHDDAVEPADAHAAVPADEHAAKPEGDQHAAKGHDPAVAEISHDPTDLPADTTKDDHAQADDHGGDEPSHVDTHAQVDMPVGD
ncbi:MAG: hypothetical protein KL863_02710 [Rhizobium sp.]|nr:hypothetical protein [Rhizobium sp.]